MCLRAGREHHKTVLLHGLTFQKNSFLNANVEIGDTVKRHWGKKTEWKYYLCKNQQVNTQQQETVRCLGKEDFFFFIRKAMHSDI